MASIEDKITRVMDGSYPNVAHVISPRAAGSDTLMTDGLSGWSTETAMNFITYRADSAGNVIEGTVRDWIGVANKANSSIINLKLLAGPEDDGSNVGDIVQPCASASYADRLAQALLESLDTDGKLKEGIVETKNIKDKAITPDKVDFASLPAYDYSSEEVDTGRKWIDRKSIYQKSITFTTKGSGTEETGANNETFDYIDKLISLDAVLNMSNGERYPNGYTNPGAPSLQYFQLKFANWEGAPKIRYQTRTVGVVAMTILYTKKSKED